MTNRGPNRTLEDALRNAERLRSEIPVLVQLEDAAYDMVSLADEIKRLRSRLAEVEQERDDASDSTTPFLHSGERWQRR